MAESMIADIRAQVDAAQWRCEPHRGFVTDCSPSDTFRHIVADSFEPAQRTVRSASLCRAHHSPELSENLGALRRSPTYTSLAPSHGMDATNRRVDRVVSTFGSYTPKRDEWRNATSLATSRTRSRPSTIVGQRSATTSTYEQMLARALDIAHASRAFYRPVDATRLDAYKVYWRSRAAGIDWGLSWLMDNENDRRTVGYHRLFDWNAKSIPGMHMHRSWLGGNVYAWPTHERLLMVY
jgi:hypothetical protein